VSPRYEWRGVMLDVARHFFGVDDVMRLTGLVAELGFNRLHLHLTDDQGWRIEIRSRPRLTALGPHYTQEDYVRLVEHAESLGVTVVPEVDMPGHVNAALVAYPELAPEGYVAEPYSGNEVGFSSFATQLEETYAFVDDVVGEVAALTPGAWLHVGGDEPDATPREEYVRFVERALAIVGAHDKVAIGWEEIARARLPAGTIVQHWKDEELLARAREQGAPVIMSPASRTYFDHKYDASTALGTTWAGYLSVRDAYEWDPGDALGVEAALWSETLLTLRDVEEMAFPRLLCTAELVSGRPRRDWEEFRPELAARAAELAARGVNVHRSPELEGAVP
jgi:hexosaminidase